MQCNLAIYGVSNDVFITEYKPAKISQQKQNMLNEINRKYAES